MADDGDDTDFLDEVIAESTARDPDFPALMEAAAQRRKATRKEGVMAEEPMTDERLAEIRRYVEALHSQRHRIEAVSSELVTAGDDLTALLAEVERLRAENAALRKAGATLLETVPDYFAHMHAMTTEQGAAVIVRMNDALDALRDLLRI